MQIVNENANASQWGEATNIRGLGREGIVASRFIILLEKRAPTRCAFHDKLNTSVYT